MDLRRLTDDYTVSPQIDPSDVALAASTGFKSIMCNRPDGEEYGQPDFDVIADAAKKAGLEVQWVPIVSGMITPDALEAFRTALEEMPKPMLAYCRTGTRCTMLWAICQHEKMDDADIARAAAEAGYDVSGLLRQLSAG